MREVVEKRKARRAKVFSVAVFLILVAVVGVVGLWIQAARRMPVAIMIVPKSAQSKLTKIIFLSFDYQNNEAKMWTRSASEQVEVPGGYGEYKLASVFPLLTIDKLSDEKIRSIVSLTSGGLTQQVWSTDQEILNDNGELDLKNLGWLVSQNLIDTKLDIFAKYKVGAFLLGVKNQHADQQRSLKDLFEQENCSVAVINTTQQAGVASKLGQVLENGNLRVVRISDEPASAAQTQLIIDADAATNCQKIANKISWLIPEKVTIKTEPQAVNRYRGELTVLIGQDLASFLRPNL